MKFLLKSFLPLFYLQLGAILMAVLFQNCTGGFERKTAAEKREHLPYEDISIEESK